MAKVITVDYEKMSYLPAVFFNDFWLLKNYLIPLNSTVKEVPLHFTISGLSGLKYMLYSQAETSFSMQASVLRSRCPHELNSMLESDFLT